MDLSEPGKKASYLTGAAVLTATVAFTKVIGAIYKIPLFNLLGDEGSGHFNVMYNIYTLILTLSTAGVPVAISRLISEARAQDRPRQAARYYSVGLWTFTLVGIVGMAVMLLFGRSFAEFMSDPKVYLGVWVLAPAVFFACVLSPLRGWSQGRSDMVPTAISQIMEVLCKLIFGIAIAWYLKSQGYGVHIIAAGAIAGITIGLGLDVPILAILRRRAARREPKPVTLDKPMSRIETLKKIVWVSVPIMLSSSVLNIINLVDSSLVRWRLGTGAGLSEQMVDVLYGVYSKGMTFFSVPNAFISPIGVAVVPVVAAAMASHDHKAAKTTIESSLRVTNLLAMPAAVGLFVLAGPIFEVVFPGSNEHGPALLSMLGIASYFVCAYLISNSILQATGHEKLALVALPVGGLLKIGINYVLVGNPAINISGAPVGTLACYMAITLLNSVFIAVTSPERPRLLRVTIRPLLCSALMGAAAWGVQGLCERWLLPALGGGRLAGAVCLAVTVLAAVFVYAVLIVLLRALTKEDILLLPKGEKLAKLLKIR